MDDYIVRMLNEHYEKDGDVRRLIAYVAGKGKNKGTEKVVSVHGRGISNDYKKAPKKMIGIQKLYGKDKGRRCYHMIVSFGTGMDDLNLAVLVADEIAYMIFEEMHYQVFYGIHTSTDHLHIHYVINAVNYKSGKKWHQNKCELARFKKNVIGIIDRMFE